MHSFGKTCLTWILLQNAVVCVFADCENSMFKAECSFGIVLIVFGILLLIFGLVVILYEFRIWKCPKSNEKSSKLYKAEQSSPSLLEKKVALNERPFSADDDGGDKNNMWL